MVDQRIKTLIVILATACFAVACSEKSKSSGFVFEGEALPTTPVITTPATDPYTSFSPNVTIEGCYNINCNPAPKFTIQASGTGSLRTSETGFTFDASMTVGETRVFSFVTVNTKGDVSAAATVTVTYDATVELLPTATLFNGGASGSNRASNGYVLNFFTSLPSLTENEISAGGFVLTSGALNPQ